MSPSTKKGITIDLLEKSRSYLAGQIIHGRVVIQNNKPKKVKEVTILLEGSGRVRWNETETYTVNETRVGDRNKVVSKTKTRTVTYNEDEKYISQKITLAGDGHNLIVLPAGVTAYTFNFELPTNLPSSFDSETGLISYFLQVEMHTPLVKSNQTESIPVTVNGKFDLNTEIGAGLFQEVTRVQGSNFLIWRKGKIGLTLKLPRSGFVPGEILDFSCEISNSSNKKVNKIKAKLFQVIEVRAQGKTKSDRKILRRVESPKVEAGEDEVWRPQNLSIPPIPPSRLGGTRSSKLIDVQYALQIKIKISGLSSSIYGELPIMIGTIPLRSTFNELCQLTPGSGVPQLVSNPLDPDSKAKEIGFVLPNPITSQHQIIPSAPFLSEYPDLRPPTYAEAVHNVASAWNSGFVPNYITYTSSRI